MSNEPIISQAEANEVFKYLVETTSTTMKISIEQAEKRVRALYESGILNGGSPDSSYFQALISEFLSKEVK